MQSSCNNFWISALLQFMSIFLLPLVVNWSWTPALEIVEGLLFYWPSFMEGFLKSRTFVGPKFFLTITNLFFFTNRTMRPDFFSNSSQRKGPYQDKEDRLTSGTAKYKQNFDPEEYFWLKIFSDPSQRPALTKAVLTHLRKIAFQEKPKISFEIHL